jgi:hypothetical protein
MKPSLTLDERGLLLHVAIGEDVVSVPVEPATVRELSATVDRARDALKTPEGRSTLVRGLGRLFAELTEKK